MNNIARISQILTFEDTVVFYCQFITKVKKTHLVMIY